MSLREKGPDEIKEQADLPFHTKAMDRFLKLFRDRGYYPRNKLPLYSFEIVDEEGETELKADFHTPVRPGFLIDTEVYIDPFSEQCQKELKELAGRLEEDYSVPIYIPK